MTITVELPKSKKEKIVTNDLSNESKQLLEERSADLKQNPHDIILWENIKKQNFKVELI
jgi:hypothetical protein